MLIDIITSLYLGVAALFSGMPTLPTYQYLKESVVQEAPGWE